MVRTKTQQGIYVKLIIDDTYVNSRATLKFFIGLHRESDAVVLEMMVPNLTVGILDRLTVIFFCE